MLKVQFIKVASVLASAAMMELMLLDSFFSLTVTLLELASTIALLVAAVEGGTTEL